MRNLIYRGGKSGYIFLNLSTSFQFSKRGKGGLPFSPTCRPVYHTIKAKKEENASGNACLKGTGTVPLTYREKHYLKNAGLKSLNFSFFFHFTQMKPFTDIFQGFLPYIQLEHLLNN